MHHGHQLDRPRPRRRSVTRAPFVVAVLVAAVILAVGQLYLTVPLLPGVAERYGIPLSTAAWVGGGFGFAFALGNLLFGTISDRYDRRHVMAVGLALGAVVSAIAGTSTAFAPLLAARSVQGFLAAAIPSVSLAYATEALPPARRAVGVTAVSGSFLLAGVIGQAYALGVDEALGWRWVFWLLAPLLLAVALTLTRLPAVPRPTPTALATTFTRLGHLLRRPSLLVAYTGGITLLLTFVGMYTALTTTVGERYGIHSAVDLLLLRLPGLPGIALGLFAGPLITRFGAHRVAPAAFLIAAAGLALEAGSVTLPVLLVGSAIFVAGLAVTIPALVTLVGRASGEARGAGLAGYGFLVGLGGGISPVLVTALAPAGFAAVCLTLAGLLILAAATLALGPQPTPAPATV
ncbi:MFS transporter [Saccharothrix sp. 6-C]|uniref:MFS transporter n=1 Tax=Saccharothrix sp. 6-C TaxID=2781735 RepID=UPI0019176FAD|nr:MFS transporter [Saccharothrix sp. 6-C]QQQ77352.1 MFS transporter [Saccharothrix sp. 6-C]